MDNKVTKKRISEHMSYDWYKYILLIVAVACLWYFVFMQINVTRKFERVDVFFACYGNNSGDLDENFIEFLEGGDYDPRKIIREANINYQNPREVIFDQLFTAAGLSSDLLVIPRGYMLRYADWFLEWDEYVTGEVFSPSGADEATLASLATLKGSLDFFVYSGEAITADNPEAVANPNSEGKIFGVRVDNLLKTDEDTITSPPFYFDMRSLASEDMSDEEFEEEFGALDNEFYLVLAPNSLKIGEKCNKEKYRDLTQTFAFASYFLLSYGS